MTLTYSQQVDWWTVHLYVVPALDRVCSWPTAGTVEWCNLRDDDPRKIAALYDAARHHAVRVDTAQHAQIQAGHAISVAVDWSRVARESLQWSAFLEDRPWLKRGAA
jgi:uncharacterized protein DUF2742